MSGFFVFELGEFDSKIPIAAIDMYVCGYHRGVLNTKDRWSAIISRSYS